MFIPSSNMVPYTVNGIMHARKRVNRYLRANHTLGYTKPHREKGKNVITCPRHIIDKYYFCKQLGLMSTSVAVN